MPIPKPNKGEQKDAFISRCMSNGTMKKEFPDQAQRSAVCNTAWKRKSEDFKRDDQGRRILAENVKIVFNGEISFKQEDNEDE